jgi:hypothetical protein
MIPLISIALFTMAGLSASYFIPTWVFNYLSWRDKKRYEAEQVAEIEETWRRFNEYVKRENPESVYLPYTGWFIQRRKT